MPILAPQPELYPADLFERAAASPAEHSWYAFYTLSRQEKEFMRKLHGHQVSFYCPMVPKRNKSPAGRIRTSYLPLFSNYVFVYGTDDQRHQALTTNCVAQVLKAVDSDELTRDLRQFHYLISLDAPILPETRLEKGDRVRIKSGRFRGIEGVVLRRENELRLLVMVNFIQRGASMLLEDFELEQI